MDRALRGVGADDTGVLQFLDHADDYLLFGVADALQGHHVNSHSHSQMVLDIKQIGIAT